MIMLISVCSFEKVRKMFFAIYSLRSRQSHSLEIVFLNENFTLKNFSLPNLSVLWKFVGR